jgi:hypothetical protein
MPKMEIDEELEKLFEGMDRETARKVNNQGCPTKRATVKKTPAKKTVTKTGTKVGTKKK